MFKVNNGNTRTSSVVNFEQVDTGWEMSRMNTPTSQTVSAHTGYARCVVFIDLLGFFANIFNEF